MIAIKIALTLALLAILSGIIASAQRFGSRAEDGWGALTGFLILGTATAIFFAIWMDIP